MIKNKQKISHVISNSKRNIVLCGYSNISKNFIKEYNLCKKKIYILDNDINLNGVIVKNINIIDINSLNLIDNPLIIIWKNHMRSFYGQVKDLLKKDIILEKRNYLTKIQNLSMLFPENFYIEIEYPDFQIIEEKDLSHKFIPILINKLLFLNQKINLRQVEYGIKEYKRERVSNKNSLLISYHSIGKKNNNILRWKEGYFNDMITFYDEGFSGWSELCDKKISKKISKISDIDAGNFFLKLKNKYINSNISKYEQPEFSSFNFPKEYIFFPLQKIEDSVMLHSYIKPLILVEKIIKILNNKKIPLIIKKHPRCSNPELECLLKKYEAKQQIILYNGSIHDVIKKAKTIYVINSGVGFESLLHLKPVVTFGKSDYMSMTRNVKDLAEIEKETFYSLNEERISDIKKFLYYYINKTSVFLDDEKKLEKILSKYFLKYLKARL